jgi:hypothetical protein
MNLNETARSLSLVQELEHGYIEHAQAVFCKGTLVGFHGYRQLSRGAGGGDATKISLLRPKVRSHKAHLGEHLQCLAKIGVHRDQPAAAVLGGVIAELDYRTDAAGWIEHHVPGRPLTSAVESIFACLPGIACH